MAAPEDECDRKLIRAFEWFSLVDGMWTETFATGVTLYKRFLKFGKLSAARTLQAQMPANRVCYDKTMAMMGKRYTLDQLMDDESLDVLDGMDDKERLHARYLAKYMVQRAKVYADLESLIIAISRLEDVAGGLYELQQVQEYVAQIGRASCRERVF